MKLWCWDKDRQGAGYEKFTLVFSRLLRCDAYILKIPKGVPIPKHTDPVPHARHYRINVTLYGHLRMQTRNDVRAFRLGDWYSFFRPDQIEHWADAPVTNAYLFSIGWLTR
jgi:hypothetical protein